ncbi:branched-chain amino acid ABC transporter permease [Pigmentiphaga litoralis]|uniref:branched-chain amino acid ABC transporter permease n=1 Tax=Pigmentiphaga litoralis TaxID=516702 RepID=UPI003B43617A
MAGPFFVPCGRSGECGLEGGIVALLNGISYGLLLFMLSAGLTLIFSMMGVINFAHASFYMLGAYAAYAITTHIDASSAWAGAGFWAALVLAPLSVGVLGALVERYGLRRVRGQGHVAELLFTFALAYVIGEVVQLIWGRSAVPYRLPESLQQPLFVVDGTQFPAYRAGMMAVAGGMLLALWILLHRTRVGLVIQAAMTHPSMVEALGHDVPRVLMAVFASGCLLAGLAGAVGGSVFVTDPGMALAVGPIVFVVTVVGGLGSLTGAFVASLLIGVLQTFAVGLDTPVGDLIGVAAGPADGVVTFLAPLLGLPLSRIAPVLPYLVLVGVLIWRPFGLLGRRES